MERAQTTQPVDAHLWSRPGVLELLACGITALVYIATLSFGFVYDDVPQILKNPAVHSWSFVPQYFTSHVWAAIYQNSTGNYYRPLFLLWLRLNYAIFGSDATGWHLTSVTCHLLATWLVFRVAQRLSGDRLTAFLAAVIFGVHPAHIENVAWISGVTDPLMACFLLGSLLAFLRFRESGQLSTLGLSLGLFALALLSKETAVVLPIMIFVLELTSGEEGDESGTIRHRIRAAIRQSVPYLLVVCVYAVVRLRALGGWSHPTIPIGWTEVFLTWPSVLWFYFRHLIFPLRMSEFYSLDYVSHATVGSVLLPAVLLIVIAVALLVVIRRLPQRSLAGFAVAFIVIPLLPVLDLHSLTIGDVVHDRYLYLPSAGFAILVAVAIREFARHVPYNKRALATTTITVTLVLTYSALALTQQMQWANDILLYTRGLESAPANLTVRDNLANALLEANQPARAIPLYLEVLSRNPNFWRSNYNLGFAYYKTANFLAAEDYLQRATRIDPSDSDQYIYLALAQLQLKRLPEAVENANRAIERNPNARGYHSILGLIYETAGDSAHAASELKTEIAQHPENAAAAAALQKLEQDSPKP